MSTQKGEHSSECTELSLTRKERMALYCAIRFGDNTDLRVYNSVAFLVTKANMFP